VEIADATVADEYWLVRARVPDVLLDETCRIALPEAAPGFRQVNLHVKNGCIQALTPVSPANVGIPIADLSDGIVMTCPVDVHTHLDKSQTASRIGKYLHSLDDAVALSGQDRMRWNEADILRRMSFSLRTAFAHGTRALRSHLDWVTPEPPLAWPVAMALRTQWASRVELQWVSICPLRLFADPVAGEAVASALARGQAILGASVHPQTGQRALLETVFSLAVKYDLDLDFHADEHLHANVDGMRSIAALTMRHGWQGRVTCGHCCALSVASEGVCQEILLRFFEAGISLVCLPMANLQLQGFKPGGTPRLRGIAPVVEAVTAGVNVCLASDNVRDAFVPFSDFDLLKLLGVSSLVAHLDDPMARWIGSITSNPAKAMGLDWDGLLRPGAPADLVILDGRDSFEVLSRANRRVIRAGQMIDSTPPSFRELDSPL
jgi:cytosine/creatinine deaminase